MNTAPVNTALNLRKPDSAARFDRQAAAYTHYAAIQRDMAAWLAQWLPAQEPRKVQQEAEPAPKVVGNRLRMLDLGAGSGTFTRYLVERCTEVSALDCAPKMLHQGERNLPQAQWLQGDAWTLEPLAQSMANFDFITSASLLQWCRNPQQTLRHWAQLCAPRTRLLHGFYVEPTLQEWRTVFGSTGQLNWRNAEQWRQYFTEAGWRVHRSECEVRSYCFTNALELARSLHGTGAIAAPGQLGSGRFRTLLRAYDAAYPATADGSTDPLHRFSQFTEAQQGNKKTSAPMHPLGAEAAPVGGVRATWAFFRIEAELD